MHMTSCPSIAKIYKKIVIQLNVFLSWHVQSVWVTTARRRSLRCLDFVLGGAFTSGRDGWGWDGAWFHSRGKGKASKTESSGFFKNNYCFSEKSLAVPDFISC